MSQQRVDDPVPARWVPHPHAEEHVTRHEPVAELAGERPDGLGRVEDPFRDARPSDEDRVARPGSRVNPDDQFASVLTDLESVLNRGTERPAVAPFREHKHVRVRDPRRLLGRGEHDRNPVRDSLARQEAHARQSALSQEPRELAIESWVPGDECDRPVSQR